MINYLNRSFARIVLTLLPVFWAANAKCQTVVAVKTGTATKEVLVLPYNFPIDKKMKDKGEIKANKLNDTGNSFNSKIYQVAQKTVAAGGNVFVISSMQDHNQGGKYKIWGNAYHTDKFEELKTSAIEQKNRKFDGHKYAYLTIYRPDYCLSKNDDLDMGITLNDTLRLDMKAKTKYIIQVDKNCKVKVANKNNLMVVTMDVQTGNTYYIRAYVNVPGHTKYIKVGDSNAEIGNYDPYYEMIDNMQGELESSLVNEITVSKKIVVQ